MQNNLAVNIIVGGLSTLVSTRSELANIMVADCLSARNDREHTPPKLVFSSNGQGIALAGKSQEFAKAMDKADIIHADGMPVVFFSKFTDHPLPERICTTDFFHDAARAAQANSLSFYILGSTKSQNDAAVSKIREMYPNVIIAGHRHGYFSEDEDVAVCEEILATQPDVVWVALGKPRQELWCVRNRDRLHGIGWLKTCGGLFSYLTGDAPRAPEWMQKAGLEWLYRTMDDPKRLIWRYLATNPYALYRLLRHTGRSKASR